ncbi:MAG: long-chain fatty acid--CoA ligase [Bacteroidetes bacterium]|nr:MAG: long-chain fatty acid--CoA ligase [Bacteroidota bacterium]MBL1144154.1 long-chain fatty acid--CoA ligase [Bacteroidota bacterium]NOG56950.1 long-chain fatty acid--CoA ligase [Bacteroidota bacterium]
MVTRIFDLHFHQLKNYPKKDALTAKINGEWVPTSTESFIDQAYQFGLGLLEKGLNPGDKVALISNNRPEWHIIDLGIAMAGMINVPIYPTITEEDYRYILNDSEAKLCFVADDELFQKVNSIIDQVSSLSNIYSIDKLPNREHWTSIKDLGKDKDKKTLDTIMDGIKETDLATLIYTSGTTGRPKGVMLSHKNLVSNSVTSRDRLPVTSNSKSLSFLPLCHVYERMVTYMYIYVGTSIYYAESLETIGDNLKEVKPDVFTAVPRLLEKVYDKIVAKGSELTGVKKALFFWALALGHRYELNGKNGAWYEFQLKLANKIIFNKWREALGGNAKAVASGAAALQPRLARVFLAAQIPIMEGYGLTETSPVICVNEQENDGVRIGTVGRPIKDVKIRIASDGEIEVTGPNVMMGYYKNPEATKEVFTEDGWFKTGDIGEIVDGDFLKITGRKKETFKTSGGKYIAPQLLENKMKESNFVEQIMVIGEGEKHPSAIIQPAFDFLKEWCNRKNIPYTSDAEMIKNQRIIDRIMKDINKYNEGFAHYEQVKKIILTPTVWSVDSGEMTPTMKIKRRVVMENYKDQIESCYRG